ncbi:hypothetical protein [Streptomyces sp. NPDC058155]|uniref:hypothetical protein n=1 Tax=Streptomyces sp. NPDC058155 TaxID=3346359 RepID=UPI0036E521D6
MDTLLPPLVIAGCLAVVMASYDEAFRATAHEAHYEIQAQAERRIPLPAPDDPHVAGGSGPYSRRHAPPRRRRSVLRRWARRLRG